MSADSAPLSILPASTNPAKSARLRACLAGWPFKILDVADFSPADPPPEDNGGTHREIAEAKALAWARRAGSLAIASDGGMTIPALGPDWDSLLTRRAAGSDATDEDRIVHFLSLMAPFDAPSDRRASWHEALAIAEPAGVLRAWETHGPTGNIRHSSSTKRIEGFWAASLWYFEQFNKTYTELSNEELEQIGDPWVRLASDVQHWLSTGGWEELRGR